jgi:hypothetical protein
VTTANKLRKRSRLGSKQVVTPRSSKQREDDPAGTAGDEQFQEEDADGKKHVRSGVWF